MAFDIQEVLKQCYWAAREYRSNPSDDYIIEKIVGFIDSNNLMADKYADLAQPRAVEKVEGLEEALEAERVYQDSGCENHHVLIEFHAKYGKYPHIVVTEAARIVAAQQKKAGGAVDTLPNYQQGAINNIRSSVAAILVEAGRVNNDTTEDPEREQDDGWYNDPDMESR